MPGRSAGKSGGRNGPELGTRKVSFPLGLATSTSHFSATIGDLLLRSFCAMC